MSEKNINMNQGWFKLPPGRAFLFLLLGIFLVNPALAQSLQEENKKLERETNKLLRSAEDNLADNDFSEAEASYRKAVSKSPENVKAKYNMANMYYTKEKASQAASRLLQAAKIAGTKEEKHKIYHNLGNSFMEQKNYRNAVEAYKNALRNNPKDEETRYNYALAKKMLEEDPESGGGEDEQDQDQDQTDKEDSDEGEQEPEEGEGENDDQGGDPDDEGQDQPNEQDENGEPDNQPGEGEPQPQQPKPGQLSPEQIRSLLEAMNNEEKKVQDKINAERAKGARTRSEKDW